MEILRVDLENVKSYRRESICFARGTNAICGYNGAGKSTILEAIGFALFDSLEPTQDQFVRQGEKTATVTVHVAGDDGRPFQVVRRCGSYSQYYVYDAEIDQKLADGKADTMGWLREFTRVERSGDLSALFRDAVGVPQGLLTAAFLDTPSRRKDVFNPLLRVDEYEEVWRALRAPVSRLKDDIAAQETRIARLEGEVKALPAEEARAAELETAIQEDQAELGTARGELEEVSGRRDEMAGVKERLEELKRAVTGATGTVATREAQWEDAREAVARAEEAQAVVAEAADGYQAYLAAEEALDALERERGERDRLEGERRTCDKALALARQRIATLEQELAAVVEAEARVEELRPDVEAQGTLEEALEEARREAQRLEGRRSELEEKREWLAQLERRLAAVEEGLAELDGVEVAIAELQRELERVEEARDRLTSDLAGCQADLTQVREQTETLATTEEATCPVCEGPLTAEHRADLLERNRAREEELGQALDALRVERGELEERRQALQAELESHQARLRTLPRPAEATELADQIARQREAVAGVEEAVAALTGAPARVETLRKELEALGDPRREYVRAADVAAGREEVAQGLAEAEEEVVELSGRLGALEEELAAYADLDERAQAQREARDTHAADHERYVAHVREAEALEERRARVEELAEALEAARAERDRLLEERDQVVEAYDAEAHRELDEAYGALRDRVATLEEGLRRQRRRLEETREAIEHLRGVEARLGEARAERDELDELRGQLEYLRGVVRDAGPKVTRVLVQVISAQAARLYADIMADHTARLQWTEDYEVVLRSGGRERTFKQLSGGEQMAAALAVRLALLREVSAIDLAFFDEPTANLDERRRDNLAEQILNVKGFSQLFVISHDDTFEQDTDHVVRVVKEDGRSRALGE
ncbi:MAG: SMC family ATPase [Chloroflexota bacterium]|nr:SMC family ATPase [Chloroflexota bacterium]